jgi:hypothetical protein
VPRYELGLAIVVEVDELGLTGPKGDYTLAFQFGLGSFDLFV